MLWTSVTPDSKCCCQSSCAALKGKGFHLPEERTFCSGRRKVLSTKMTSKPEILPMEQCERALGELCWITRNTFERKRLLKALGHQLRLLHTATLATSSACSAQDNWEKPKICIFQALLRIPNKPQNRSGGQRLQTPQQSRLLSWLLLRVPSGN